MPREIDDLLARVDQCSTQAHELSSQFEELRDQIHQAISIAKLDPEMSLARARKVLEYIVRDIYDDAFKPKRAGTQPLEGLVQTLVKEGHFPNRLAAYANMVRGLGNVGVHDFDKGVSSQDVLNSLSNLMPIVEWFFEQRKTPSAVGGPSIGETPPGSSATAATPVRAASAAGPAVELHRAKGATSPPNNSRAAWAKPWAIGVGAAVLAACGIGYFAWHNHSADKTATSTDAISTNNRQTPGDNAGKDTVASLEPKPNEPLTTGPADPKAAAAAASVAARSTAAANRILIAPPRPPATAAKTPGSGPTDDDVISIVGGRVSAMLTRFPQPEKAQVVHGPFPDLDSVLIQYGSYEYRLDHLNVEACFFNNLWTAPIHGIKIGATQAEIRKVLGDPDSSDDKSRTDSWNLTTPSCRFAVVYNRFDKTCREIAVYAK